MLGFWNKRPEKTFDDQNASSLQNPYCEFTLPIAPNAKIEFFYLFNVVRFIACGDFTQLQTKFGGRGANTTISEGLIINLDQITDRIEFFNLNGSSTYIKFGLGVGGVDFSASSVSVSNTVTTREDDTGGDNVLQYSIKVRATATLLRAATQYGNREIIIQNVDVNPFWLGFDSGVKTDAMPPRQGYKLLEGDTLTLNDYTGSIYGISTIDMAAENAIILEMNYNN